MSLSQNLPLPTRVELTTRARVPVAFTLLLACGFSRSAHAALYTRRLHHPLLTSPPCRSMASKRNRDHNPPGDDSDDPKRGAFPSPVGTPVPAGRHQPYTHVLWFRIQLRTRYVHAQMRAITHDANCSWIIAFPRTRWHPQFFNTRSVYTNLLDDRRAISCLNCAK